MERKFTLYILLIIIIIFLGVTAYYLSQTPISPQNSNMTNQSDVGHVGYNQTDAPVTRYSESKKGSEGYLRISGENLSKIYLINSTISYAVSEDNFKNVAGDIILEKGEPYVVISGTLRNDYENDKYLKTTASIYNVDGVKIGEVLRGKFEPDFNSPNIFINSHSQNSFEMRIIYDKKDISYYDIYLPMEPTDRWLPQ